MLSLCITAHQDISYMWLFNSELSPKDGCTCMLLPPMASLIILFICRAQLLSMQRWQENLSATPCWTGSGPAAQPPMLQPTSSLLSCTPTPPSASPVLRLCTTPTSSAASHRCSWLSMLKPPHRVLASSVPSVTSWPVHPCLLAGPVWAPPAALVS